MQPLPLSPLPSAIPAEEDPHVICGDCDFVDEAVVRALMAGPIVPMMRENAGPDSTATGNALDFAGWCLPRPAAGNAGSRRPSSTIPARVKCIAGHRADGSQVWPEID